MPHKQEWLYYYVVLAESESFNVAADRLCISQQALSKHLAQIEDRLGGQLIQRSQRFEKLTPAGELLLAKARHILARAEKLEMLFSDKGASDIPTELRLAAAPLLEPRVLSFLRQTLAERAGQIQPLVLESLSASEIVACLERGDLEVGFLPSLPRGTQLQSQLFSQSPFQIVLAPPRQDQVSGQYAHDGQPPQSWQDLSYLRVADREPGIEVWPEDRYPRQVVAEADLDTSLALCMRGAGALLLPKVLAEPLIRAGRLSPGPAPPFEAVYRSYLLWSDRLRQSSELWDLLQRLLQLRQKAE
jgi:DNA-binding transcriptional LysR family regulator